MLKNFLTLILVVSTVFWGVAASATDYSSVDFTVKDSVITPGGNYATSSSYNLWSSFGQPAIGLSSTSSFVLKSGFLYFPAVIVTTTTVTTTPPQPIGVPGGGGLYFFNATSGISISLKPKILLSCDFNNDGKCNIFDLSIMLYYYGQSGSQISRYDLGNFGVIDIRDISILFFYWTD